MSKKKTIRVKPGDNLVIHSEDFSTLRAKMSPASRKRSRKLAKKMMQEVTFKPIVAIGSVTTSTGQDIPMESVKAKLYREVDKETHKVQTGKSEAFSSERKL